MKILSIDPGLVNFAYALIDTSHKILEVGHIRNTIDDLTKGRIQFSLTTFASEIMKIVNYVKDDDLILIERYMPRGKMKGTTAESVNMMIGTIFTLCDCNFDLVHAATWKQYFNRNYKTKEQTIWDLVKNGNLSDHEMDAIGLAAHYMEVRLEIKNSWKKLKKLAKAWK